jgi:hypothetical protein
LKDWLTLRLVRLERAIVYGLLRFLCERFPSLRGKRAIVWLARWARWANHRWFEAEIKRFDLKRLLCQLP